MIRLACLYARYVAARRLSLQGDRQQSTRLKSVCSVTLRRRLRIMVQPILCGSYWGISVLLRPNVL